MASSEWLTWQEAADLVGCPVATIDWWKRQGRIRSRGRVARSLDRESVEEFGLWWRAREEARKNKPEKIRKVQEPPEPSGWITSREAAGLMGVSTSEVGYLVAQGQLRGSKVSRRLWVDLDSVNAHVAEESRYVSQAAAGEIIGVSSTTVGALARRGLVTTRTGVQRRASVLRESAEAHAVQFRAQQEDAARVSAAKTPVRSGPPDDGQVWLSLSTTAVLLGISNQRVGQLVRADRLPATRRGKQWWIRRDHAEQRAAARSLRASLESLPG